VYCVTLSSVGQRYREVQLELSRSSHTSRNNLEGSPNEV
jgi:hypothetical protein